MRFNPFQRGFDLMGPGERMRRYHQGWLNRTLRRPDHEQEGLRIPVRRVDQGGFDGMTSVPGGRERADQWWFEAFMQMERFR